MYDAVLISPHYHYDADGMPIPAPETSRHQDLSLTIPLGILHLAQYLHDCGFNLRVLHLPQEIYALERLGLRIPQLNNPIAAILSNYPARVCAIQSHFYLYCGGAVRVAEMYKHLFPEATVLVGGYMATAFWAQFLDACPAIDGVVLGEGEETLRKVVEHAIASGRPGLPAEDGIARRRSDGHGSAIPAREDAMLGLQDMPIVDPAAPPFERLMWPSRSFLNIARGLCPETCAYCVANNPSINPRSYRSMPIDRIIDQLRVYRRNGVRSVFLGENHFLDTAFLTELVRRFRRETLDMTFELETHPALFSVEGLLPDMIAVGFQRFTMGAESGSEKLLKRMGRGLTPAKMLDSVKRIADAGGLAVTAWICNLPGETGADVAKTAALLDSVVDAGGLIYWIENLHVLPGSRLYRHPEKWGLDVRLKTLADWVRWSLLSKTYVAPEEALEAPERYLTHVNHDTAPREMIRRLYALRQQARDRVPDMQANLEGRRSNLSPALHRMEKARLEWYAAKGWQLLLF